MIIRDFQPNDLDQVMKIWLEGNLNAHPFVDRKYWINNFEMVRDALQQSEIIVIEDKLQIIGFVGMQNTYLAGIFVKNKFRRHGVGSKLLNAIKRKYDSFTLEVYAENQAAVSFYNKQGLKIVRKQSDEMGNKEYLMQWGK